MSGKHARGVRRRRAAAMIPGVTRCARTTRAVLGLLSAVVVCALIGCAHEPTAGGRLGVRAEEDGLELRWWMVDDTSGSLARVLSKYEDRPVPMRDSVRQLWRANGLVVLSVPVAELAALREDLRRARRSTDAQRGRNASRPVPGRSSISIRVHEEWLGQRPRWTEIMGGPVMPHGAVLAMDNGPVRLGPGRMRLLARCWSVPLMGSPERVPAGLRVELALQYADLERRGGLRWTAGADDASEGEDDRGLVFSRFVAEMIALEGDALVVATVGRGALGDEPERPREAVGPATSLPTIGQALLSDPRGGAATGAPKVVLVLIGRTSEEYTLINR